MSFSNGYYEARESWRDWRIEAQELMTRARVGPGCRVLEIGCGGGGLLRLVEQRGACAIGVDTLASALELALKRADRTQSGRVVLIGGKSSLPFGHNSFDAIVGQHVLEHLPDVKAALGELARVLRPGARLALATPNRLYPDPAHFSDSDHVHIFAPDELAATIARAGFAVESCSSIFPYLSSLRVLRAVGIVGYRVFSKAPYFSEHGRTILVAARKTSAGLW